VRGTKITYNLKNLTLCEFSDGEQTEYSWETVTPANYEEIISVYGVSFLFIYMC
jgi:hypothetical protein